LPTKSALSAPKEPHRANKTGPSRRSIARNDIAALLPIHRERQQNITRHSTELDIP
jgi:hypothetical protein